ncbi:MAG TPA: HDOD domain-containing protein [Mycobacteriales bacterium]|nr:HDOD domain-containing protein [Mycobacteriales bacterium]
MRVGAARRLTDQFVHVGRQPIWDREHEIIGYELLFRADERATGAVRAGSEATSQVIVSAFTDFGLERLVGANRLGFVNLTRDFLVGNLPVPFEPGQAVLEVLETVTVDDDVLAGVQALADAGYPIALDDFELGSGHERLLPLASYVKLQVAGMDPTLVTTAVEICRQYPNVKLVAERLETDEDLSFARELGFELFQGYLLGRPQVLSAAALSPTRLRRIELIGYLGQPDVDMKQIISIVTLDPALSYRILRATNSAAMGRSRPVSSVHEAIMMLGTTRLLQWLSLIAMSDLGAPGEEHLVPILSRARMCQLVAERLCLDPAAAFTLGMLVGVGDLLDTPMSELIAQLPLTEEVSDALVGGGKLGNVLAAVRAYENGTEPGQAGLAISGAELARAYLTGLDWAMRTYRAVLGWAEPRPLGRPGPVSRPGSSSRA